MAFYDEQDNEIINVTLKNSKGSKTAPYTTAEQVEAVSLTNQEETIRLDNLLVELYSTAGDAYDEATSAYNLANHASEEAASAYCRADEASEEAASAYCRADEAYSEATDAYNQANNAYDLANTNSGYLQNVKTIFSDLAGTMYNPGTEDSMGYIYGGNPTVSQINGDLITVSGRADSAYNIANDAYYIAGSIYNRESGKAADTYSEGTYLLKATVDSNKNITFTWVNEADYKNVYSN